MPLTLLELHAPLIGDKMMRELSKDLWCYCIVDNIWSPHIELWNWVLFYATFALPHNIFVLPRKTFGNPHNTFAFPLIHYERLTSISHQPVESKLAKCTGSSIAAENIVLIRSQEKNVLLQASSQDNKCLSNPCHSV